MGPNGSGKSTLLRVLSTAIAPDAGTFRVGGADGLKEQRKVRATHGPDGRPAYALRRPHGEGERLLLRPRLRDGERPRPRASSPSSSTTSTSRSTRTTGSRPTPTGWARSSRSSRRWRTGRRCCFWTSPRSGSTTPPSSPTSARSGSSPPPAWPSCSRATRWTRSSPSATASAFLHRGKVRRRGHAGGTRLLRRGRQARRGDAAQPGRVRFGRRRSRVSSASCRKGGTWSSTARSVPGIVADVVAGLVAAGGDIVNLVCREAESGGRVREAHRGGVAP